MIHSDDKRQRQNKRKWKINWKIIQSVLSVICTVVTIYLTIANNHSSKIVEKSKLSAVRAENKKEGANYIKKFNDSSSSLWRCYYWSRARR